MIVAVVPAAGKSQRMGRQKLLLPLGRRLVLEHVLLAINQSPIDRTFVVIPPGADALFELASRFERVDAIQLHEPTPDMRSSILAGLTHIETMSNFPSPEAFLIALADQPTISPNIVQALIDACRGHSHSIVVPTHHGKKGHPILFAWDMLEQIRAIPADQGLNYLLARAEYDVACVPIDGHEPLFDLDTPADYERIRQAMRDGGRNG